LLGTNESEFDACAHVGIFRVREVISNIIMVVVTLLYVFVKISAIVLLIWDYFTVYRLY
jgi:hypothetical protein